MFNSIFYYIISSTICQQFTNFMINFFYDFLPVTTPKNSNIVLICFSFTVPFNNDIIDSTNDPITTIGVRYEHIQIKKSKRTLPCII